MRLTDLAIQKIPFGPQRRIWDESTPGFGILVGKRRKTFIVMYGKGRRLSTLGHYPDKSLKEARQEARRILASPEPGRRSESHSEALTAYLEDCQTRLRHNTLRVYRHFLTSVDYSGPLSEITRRKLNLTGSHAINAWKIYFNWCIKNDLLDRNPLQGERITYKQRDRVLTDEEVRLIWHYTDEPFSRILKILILTGLRRNEVSTLHSEHIEQDALTIPAHLSKNKKPHTVPIGPLTSRLLTGEGFLFGNEKGTTFSGWSKSKARLDRELALPHWTIHDIRRTFATVHARIGTPIHITEALLNHVSGTRGGIVGLYQRYDYMKEMREAVLRYEAELTKLVSP